MKSSRKKSTGGTLLEVLVSLIIVTLVASSLVEISGQRRRAFVQGKRNQTILQRAMNWRTARLTGQDWAKGESGSFPDAQAHWALQTIAPADTEGKIGTDSAWRSLDIVLDPDDSTNRVSFLMRIENQNKSVAVGGNARE